MFQRNSDRILQGLLRGLTVLSAGIVLLVVTYLLLGSIPALRSVGLMRFFTDRQWFPAEGAESGSFGMGPMLFGSLAATLGAILIAAPLGILSAIFLHLVAPRGLRSAYRRMVELLAGIPSVVYGFWGLVTLAPWIRRIEPPGPSLLTGSLILAIMILPTVALLVDAAFSAVPQAQTQAAAALGLSRLGVLRSVYLPSSKAGMAVALLLGTTRAVGETMAVLMVCGNVIQVPGSVFEPVRTLTANIALELSYATSDHRSALFVLGLVLMALVLILVSAAEWAKARMVHA